MKSQTLCYLCNKDIATTEDHVPAKTFFPKDYQRKGYKIPACASCNSMYSKDEEYVRDSFSIAGQNNVAHQVFQEGTRRSYLRPYSRLQPVTKHERILSSLVRLNVKTPAGIHLRTDTAIKIKISRIQNVAVKIVKGLFFVHAGKSIPSDFQFSFFMDPKDFLLNLLQIKSPVIGRFDDIFAYKAIIAKDDLTSGIWWLSFYQSLGMIVVVESPRIVQLLNKSTTSQLVT